MMRLCVCVRSCKAAWNLRLQIAVEWLHDCCHLLLPCASIHVGLPRDAAKCIVMAAWTLHGACVGEEAGARNNAFFRVKALQPVMKGNCVRGGCGLGSFCRFFFVAMQRWLQAALDACVCVCVCVAIGRFGICGCRSQWNGCVIVVIFCCHVRRCKQVCHGRLQKSVMT